MPFRYKATRAEVDDAMSVPGRGRSGVGGAWRWCRLTEVGMLASFCTSAMFSTVGVAAFIAAASVSIIAAFIDAASIPISIVVTAVGATAVPISISISIVATAVGATAVPISIAFVISISIPISISIAIAIAVATAIDVAADAAAAALGPTAVPFDGAAVGDITTWLISQLPDTSAVWRFVNEVHDPYQRLIVVLPTRMAFEYTKQTCG